MIDRIRLLMQSIREFRRDTILTPVMVIGEVVMEALIPYTIALLINEIRDVAGVDRIIHYARNLIAK